MLGRYNDFFSRFTSAGGASYGGCLTYEGEDFNLTLNALAGSSAGEQDIIALALVGELSSGEKTRLGAELVYQPFRYTGEAWMYCYSTGLYLVYDLSGLGQLALRTEWVDDTGGINFAPKTTIVHGSVAFWRLFGA